MNAQVRRFVGDFGGDSTRNCRQTGTGRQCGRRAMSVEVRTADGIAEVVIDFPPVNALPVQGWFDLASAVPAAGADTTTRAVILAAAGRGFCAGVDIKEMQRTQAAEGG